MDWAAARCKSQIPPLGNATLRRAPPRLARHRGALRGSATNSRLLVHARRRSFNRYQSHAP